MSTEQPTQMAGQKPEKQMAGEKPKTLAQEMASMYIESFGPGGARYFAEGYSFEEASAIVIAEKNEEIRRLDEKIAKLKETSMIPEELLEGGPTLRQL